MKRLALPRVLRRRGMPLMVGIAIVGSALVVAGAGEAGGTFALWSDSMQTPATTITAGAPQFTVTGLEGLNFGYSAGHLIASAQLALTNTGDTELHGFTAAASLADGDTELFDATSIMVTPFGDGQSVDISHWAESTRVAPGDTHHFTMTTSIADGAVAALAETDAVTTILISARIGTSWAAIASGNFTQAVGTTQLPEPGGDDFNTTVITDSPWTIEIRWENPSGLPLFIDYRVYIGGILIPNTGSNIYWAQFNMTNTIVPEALRRPGETVPVVVTIEPDLPDWTGGAIAQRTIWVTTQSNGDVALSSAPPAG